MGFKSGYRGRKPPAPAPAPASTDPSGGALVSSDWRPIARTTFGPLGVAGDAFPSTAQIYIDADGHIIDGTDRVTLWMASLGECAVNLKIDVDIDDMLDRIVAHGYNSVRLFPSLTRKYTESSNTNWGCAADSGIIASTTAMAQFDKTINGCLDRGLYIMLSNNSYWEYPALNGTPARKSGTYRGYGMEVLPSIMAEWQDWIGQVYLRDISRDFAGQLLCQHPKVIVEFQNEEGFTYTFYYGAQTWDGSSTRMFDKIVAGGTGYTDYKTELDDLINDFYTLNSWTLPNGRFPTYAEAVAWTGSDEDHWLEFCCAQDVRIVTELVDWIRGYNPDVPVCVGTVNYMTPETRWIARDNLMATVHQYLPDGMYPDLNNKQAPRSRYDANVYTNYPSLNNVGRNGGTGSNGSAVGFHPRAVSMGCNECGEYGTIGRWSYQSAWWVGTFRALQDDSHICIFHEGQQYIQQLFQDKDAALNPLPDPTPGITSFHHNVGAPSRQLGAMGMAPVFKYRFLDPLPSHITTVSIATLRTAQKATNPFQIWVGQLQEPSSWTYDGTERAWAKGRFYLETDTVDDLDNATYDTYKVTDTTFNNAAGVQATSQVWWGSVGIRFTAARIVGWVDQVQNNTLLGIAGAQLRVTLGNSVALPNAVCVLRSDGPWDLGDGPAKFFFYSHDFQADAIGGPGPGNIGPQYRTPVGGGVCANQAAMVALSTAVTGDWCYRSDTLTNWQLTGADYSNAAHWTSGYNAWTGADGECWTKLGARHATRLRIPKPATVEFAIGVNCVVTGVDKLMVGHVMASSWDGTFVRFITNSEWPVYQIDPI